MTAVKLLVIVLVAQYLWAAYLNLAPARSMTYPKIDLRIRVFRGEGRKDFLPALGIVSQVLPSGYLEITSHGERGTASFDTPREGWLDDIEFTTYGGRPYVDVAGSPPDEAFELRELPSEQQVAVTVDQPLGVVPALVVSCLLGVAVILSSRVRLWLAVVPTIPILNESYWILGEHFGFGSDYNFYGLEDVGTGYALGLFAAALLPVLAAWALALAWSRRRRRRETPGEREQEAPSVAAQKAVAIAGILVLVEAILEGASVLMLLVWDALTFDGLSWLHVGLLLGVAYVAVMLWLAWSIRRRRRLLLATIMTGLLFVSAFPLYFGGVFHRGDCVSLVAHVALLGPAFVLLLRSRLLLRKR